MIRWSRRVVSATVARARFEHDMRRELGAHLELRADDLEASGLSREEAIRRARVEFGGMERYKEQCRDARGFAAFRPLHGSLQDLQLAVRRLAATPVFFLFGIASLAVAVAVTSVAYALLYSVFWKPLGAADPERVLLVTTPAGRSVTWSGAVSLPDFEDLQRAQTSFVSMAASTRVAPSVATRLGAEMAIGEAVTPEYFAALGVRPILGRLIGLADADHRVAVISKNLWRERFDADQEIVGQTVLLNGQRFDVIGVTDFAGLGAPEGASQDVWIPLNARAALSAVSPPNRRRRSYVVFGRLKEGIPRESAAAELQAFSQRLDAEFPIQEQDGSAAIQRRWGVRGLDNPHPDSEIHRAAAVVLALVGLVLVVACTNLANLMLARGATRAQELAMRRALGASPWRLVREMCAEGLIIAVVGALLSLLVMQGLLNLATLDIPTPRGAFYLRPEINVFVLAAALGAVFLSVLVFSLEPAIHLARRTQVTDVTRGLAPGAIERTRRHWMLVRGQVAICVCFFLVAALLVRFVAATAVHDSGIELSRLSLATVHFRFNPGQWDEAQARRTVTDTLQAVRREAGVRTVAVATGTPFGMRLTPSVSVTTPDKPFADTEHSPEMRFVNQQDYVDGSLVIASDSIFDTLGVPVFRGRAFDQRDGAGAPLVAVLSQRAAVQVFGAEDAIGRQLLLRSNTRVQPDLRSTVTVIGIARDTDVGELLRRNDGTVYLPLEQSYQSDLAFIVNSDREPAGMARQLQTAIAKVAPDLPVGTVGSGLMMLAPELVAARVAGGLAGALGAVTLLLAMIGLYGIQSAIVTRRTREVGVRIALGAAAHQIHRMILRDGLVPVAQGVVVGLVFGTLVRLTLRAVLNAGIVAVDPPALIAVALVLGIAGALACYVPARRAARVDPNVALRAL
jgi:predicted permease